MSLVAYGQETKPCSTDGSAKPVLNQAGGADTTQIEVKLIPDKSTIMLGGEPVYLAFVVLNHSDQNLQVTVGGDYRNSLGRPESFCVTAFSEDGEKVAQPDVGQTMGARFGPQKIPANGSYTFKLFLGDWATFEKVGNYFVTSRRVLSLSRFGDDHWRTASHSTQTEMMAQATAKLEIIPRDDKRMGEVIDSLGTALLERRYVEANRPAKSLAYIDDERAIPYLVKALRTKDYSMKFAALRALGKFNNDTAVEALKEGMETQGDDMRGEATREGADQLAVNIRNIAAYSLSQSKHPGAIPFLLSRRADKSEGVRLTILHALGKMKPDEALPILREMTRDENPRVSNEAKRYVQLLEERLK